MNTPPSDVIGCSRCPAAPIKGAPNLAKTFGKFPGGASLAERKRAPGKAGDFRVAREVMALLFPVYRCFTYLLNPPSPAQKQFLAMPLANRDDRQRRVRAPSMHFLDILSGARLPSLEMAEVVEIDCIQFPYREC